MDEVTEITLETKRQIVQQRLQVWQNTVYEAHLDARVAKITEDEQLLQAAQARAKKALQAVTLLKQILEELNGSRTEATADRGTAGEDGSPDAKDLDHPAG